MTTEQLLGFSAEELAARTDEELLEYFKDILVYTRIPEKKPVKVESNKEQIRQLMELAKMRGITLDPKIYK